MSRRRQAREKAADAAPEAPRPTREALLAAVPIILLVLLSAEFLGQVPGGDGRVYFDWLHDAVTRPFSLFNFACNDHPCVAYLLWLGLPQYAFPDSMPAVHLADVALVAAAVWAFQDLLAVLFGAVAGPGERALMAALFAVNPALIACTSSPSPELGSLAALLWLLRALVRGRRVQAALAGLFLVFTKEPAIAFYPMLVAAYLVLWVTRHEPPGGRVRALAREAGLLLPPAALALYLAWKVGVNQGPAFYAATEVRGGASLSLFLDLNLSAPMLQAALMEIFGASFNWLMTLWIAALAARGIWRFCFAVEVAPEAGDPRPRQLVAVALPLAVYAFTRALPYTIPRYVLPVLPLFLCAAYRGLTALVRRPAVRCAYLAACVLLGLVSTHVTLDPVSRAYWGTFEVGERSLLAICKRTGEYGGLGQDQLLYNLQYLELLRLTDDLLAWMKPGPDTVIIGPMVFMKLRGPLDPVTFARTLDGAHGISPVVLGPDQLRRRGPLPDEICTIDYPNMLNRRGYLELIAQYTVVDQHTAERHGHALTAYRMRKKG